LALIKAGIGRLWMSKPQKLELTWIGKDELPRLDKIENSAGRQTGVS